MPKSVAMMLAEWKAEQDDLDPVMRGDTGSKSLDVPEGVDVETLQKVLENPETAALLSALVKSMGEK